jgi:hypothetical protein
MAEYIDKVQAMNIIASGKNDNAYFGTTDKDWEVIDFLKTVPTANVVEIPEGATNGDMIKAMFPNVEFVCGDYGISTLYMKMNMIDVGFASLYKEWWNAPYKRGNKNEIID